jgi:hypothetical protein
LASLIRHDLSRALPEPYFSARVPLWEDTFVAALKRCSSTVLHVLRALRKVKIKIKGVGQ